MFKRDSSQFQTNFEKDSSHLKKDSSFFKKTINKISGHEDTKYFINRISGQVTVTGKNTVKSVSVNIEKPYKFTQVYPSADIDVLQKYLFEIFRERNIKKIDKYGLQSKLAITNNYKNTSGLIHLDNIYQYKQFVSHILSVDPTAKYETMIDIALKHNIASFDILREYQLTEYQAKLIFQKYQLGPEQRNLLFPQLPSDDKDLYRTMKLDDFMLFLKQKSKISVIDLIDLNLLNKDQIRYISGNYPIPDRIITAYDDCIDYQVLLGKKLIAHLVRLNVLAIKKFKCSRENIDYISENYILSADELMNSRDFLNLTCLSNNINIRTNPELLNVFLEYYCDKFDREIFERYSYYMSSVQIIRYFKSNNNFQVSESLINSLLSRFKSDKQFINDIYPIMSNSDCISRNYIETFMTNYANQLDVNDIYRNLNNVDNEYILIFVTKFFHNMDFENICHFINNNAGIVNEKIIQMFIDKYEHQIDINNIYELIWKSKQISHKFFKQFMTTHQNRLDTNKVYQLIDGNSSSDYVRSIVSVCGQRFSIDQKVELFNKLSIEFDRLFQINEIDPDVVLSQINYKPEMDYYLQQMSVQYPDLTLYIEIYYKQYGACTTWNDSMISDILDSSSEHHPLFLDYIMRYHYRQEIAHTISKFPNLPEPFIEKYKNILTMDYVAIYSDLSIGFIQNNIDKLCIYNLKQNTNNYYNYKIIFCSNPTAPPPSEHTEKLPKYQECDICFEDRTEFKDFGCECKVVICKKCYKDLKECPICRKTEPREYNNDFDFYNNNINF
jgi:hypothetical protein